MKKLTLAAAMSLTLVSTAAMAGSVSDPVVEADVIVADSGSSSSGTVMGIMMLALLLAVTD